MLKGPEREFHFDPKEMTFKTTPIVDPITGVVTEWEKKIRGVMTWLTRIDRLPHGPRRRIAYSEYSPRENPAFSEEYSVSHIVDGIVRKIELHIELHQVANSADLSLVMFLDKQGAFLYFDAQYTAKGALKDFRLSFRPKSSSEMLPGLSLLEKINHFEDRSLEENLKELGQIFNMRGEAALWVGADLEGDDAQAENYELDSLNEEFGKWPADMIEEMSLDVYAIIGITIMKYLRGLSDEQIATMLSALTPQVIKKLLTDFEKQHSISGAFTTEALHIVVADLLGCYYEKLKEVGGMEVRFTTSEEDPRRFLLSVREERTNQSLVEALVGLGEAYPYEEYSYVIEKEGGQKIRLLRRSVVNSNLREVITFPAFLDPRIIDLLTIEENVGWERALELAEVTYKGSDN